MAQKRDTYKYELKQGNKVVYVGITDDPGRREQEHRNDGKQFTSMNIVGYASTRQGASAWEEQRIQTYMGNHHGQTPQYNKNETGK